MTTKGNCKNSKPFSMSQCAQSLLKIPFYKVIEHLSPVITDSILTRCVIRLAKTRQWKTAIRLSLCGNWRFKGRLARRQVCEWCWQRQMSVLLRAWGWLCWAIDCGLSLHSHGGFWWGWGCIKAVLTICAMCVIVARLRHRVRSRQVVGFGQVGLLPHLLWLSATCGWLAGYERCLG